jgi:hypothetical protein
VSVYFLGARSLRYRNAWHRRELAWRIEERDGRQFRRALLDVETGAVLDDVWLDGDGRVRSFSAPPNTDPRDWQGNS